MFDRLGRSSGKAKAIQSHSLIQYIFLLAEAIDEFVEDNTNSVDGIIEALMTISSFKGLNAVVVSEIVASGSGTGSQSDSEIK